VIIRGSIFSRFTVLVEFTSLKLIPFAMGDRHGRSALSVRASIRIIDVYPTRDYCARDGVAPWRSNSHAKTRLTLCRVLGRPIAGLIYEPVQIHGIRF